MQKASPLNSLFVYHMNEEMKLCLEHRGSSHANTTANNL